MPDVPSVAPLIIGFWSQLELVKLKGKRLDSHKSEQSRVQSEFSVEMRFNAQLV